MFKEKRVLRKLLIFAAVLFMIFGGYVAVWEMKIGKYNSKYTLPDMYVTEFDDYEYEGEEGELYRIYKAEFILFNLSTNFPQLSISSGSAFESPAYLRFFKGERMKDYPDKEITSGVLYIFPRLSLEEGRYEVTFSMKDYAEQTDNGYSMCVDAKGEYYLMPGVSMPEEVQALAKAMLEDKRDLLDYLFEKAKEAWGEELFGE